LCIAGIQRFEGYLNSDKKNINYFISQKNKEGELRIYYRTGDRVKIDLTGNMLYLGRTDQQVKINGYRIELGEIEFAFSKVESIKKALVFCMDNNGENELPGKSIIACVEGSISSTEAAIRLREILPAYMIPSKIIVKNEFPLNSNGKIDRRFVKQELFCRQYS
jgi:acyl-coenzyme A synthetase/AMP-(fatty) acid ligase